MSGLLFVPQALLDDWLQEGLADLTAEGLQVPSASVTLQVEAAYRFTAVLDGADDAGLQGKVKTERQLRDLGAEPYGDSVLLGEVVYEVVPGFTARTPSLGQRAEGREWQTGGGALKQPGSPPAANASADGEAEGADRLRQFFG
ncbi:MAG TPA: hypothetical protein VN033_04530 [Vulgatibacter sp.]|nr:hypothetical protein [Vulgatibacter sp.]